MESSAFLEKAMFDNGRWVELGVIQVQPHICSHTEIRVYYEDPVKENQTKYKPYERKSLQYWSKYHYKFSDVS